MSEISNNPLEIHAVSGFQHQIQQVEKFTNIPKALRILEKLNEKSEKLIGHENVNHKFTLELKQKKEEFTESQKALRNYKVEWKEVKEQTSSSEKKIEKLRTEITQLEIKKSDYEKKGKLAKENKLKLKIESNEQKIDDIEISVRFNIKSLTNKHLRIQKDVNNLFKNLSALEYAKTEVTKQLQHVHEEKNRIRQQLKTLSEYDDIVQSIREPVPTFGVDKAKNEPVTLDKFSVRLKKQLTKLENIERELENPQTLTSIIKQKQIAINLKTDEPVKKLEENSMTFDEIKDEVRNINIEVARYVNRNNLKPRPTPKIGERITNIFRNLVS
ncbi:MAG: hypothetical protein Tsb0021_09640 [Chlamydiales bacterium]